MVKGLAEDAVELPWLSPGAASLVALAGAPCAAVWTQVRADPGCVLLLVRHSFPSLTQLGLDPLPLALRDAELLRAARETLQLRAGAENSQTGFADWNQATLQPIHQASVAYARVAHRLARESKQCDPDLAWIAGLLAPLGWLALGAVAPQETADCLHAGRSAERREVEQRNRFGMDVTALARRLNQRWRLPGWLGAVTGHLALPFEVAVGLGADWYLFPLVQLAVGLVEEQGQGLQLTCAQAPAELCERLNLDLAQVRHWFQDTLAPAATPRSELCWENPAELKLLPELLHLAENLRRRQDEPGTALVQQQVDVLHDALLHRGHEAGDNLRQQKLTALAEFAAGAAHEINNPLAVISGHAQYLLNKEVDLDRRDTLQKVIKQTQRIHSILTDVLLFARPTAPKKQMTDIGVLIREAANSLQGLASLRKVNLVCPEPATPITLHADPDQVARALSCLLRNAIEAAPEQGWAGIRVETPQPHLLHFIVEDNGRGPNPAHRDKLFDPFFSGRNAGRGRGLGLPIAWRLARLHDGDITLAESGTGPTRFIFSLPITPAPAAGHQRNGTVEHVTLPLAATG